MLGSLTVLGESLDLGAFDAPFDPMRIMVVDDDRALGRALGRILRGHEIIVEHEGGRALERIEAGDWFDLIVCDLHMPRWNGLDLIARMKALYGDVDRSVFVLMTGDEDLPRTGADFFIRKPFGIDEMLGLVTVVHDRRNRRSLAATPRDGIPSSLAR